MDSYLGVELLLLLFPGLVARRHEAALPQAGADLRGRQPLVLGTRAALVRRPALARGAVVEAGVEEAVLQPLVPRGQAGQQQQLGDGDGEGVHGHEHAFSTGRR